MKLKFFLALVLLIAVATSCKKADATPDSNPPTAEFKIQNQNDEVNEGAALKVTNTSSGSTNVSYLWDFGNGKTSTEKEPTIAFGMHGFYNLKLTVTDNQGRSSTTTQTVTVVCIYAVRNHPALF